MTWTKLSDDFSDDCDGLSDHAFRLHVEGLCWSNRKLFNLRLPKARMGKWATHPEAASELVAAGYWAEDGDAYVIRHHAGYQRTREQVIAQQTANAQNGRMGGRPKKSSAGPPRETWTETESVSDSKTQSVSDPKTERDRAGRTGSGQYGESGSAYVCRVCGKPDVPAGASVHSHCAEGSDVCAWCSASMDHADKAYCDRCYPLAVDTAPKLSRAGRPVLFSDLLSILAKADDDVVNRLTLLADDGRGVERRSEEAAALLRPTLLRVVA
ncbi:MULTISPECIES: hypothetical protein [Gordonia]|uniref:Uncharacterized protein n=1 Tax=Gordonia amicalis TaxID=89053 RepID=A0ABU4D7Q8_9ACTN|nr:MULTISPECIES: hypothetical protein [Gordonia]ATD70505.1 hypothetical protein CNO18_09675 [Gordonia sp. 1D]MCZ4581812.1 hypothetical protein [Gordonia amicalis]MCZ4651124.1 hypothetical protein [Gordonia amicalis]MDJ0452146.1 hypothetical protein [Gordonia amicalis]MDV6305759.1 hypothetical protein [Gordonia amicalis]